MKFCLLAFAVALAGCTALPPSQGFDRDVKCQTGRNEIHVTAEHCNALGGFVIPRANARD